MSSVLPTNKRVYFITGSSGVGKSSLVKELKNKHLRQYDIHDFDEVGVPNGANQDWRIKTTETWLTLGKNNLEEGVLTIVIGLTHPDEVEEIAIREKIIVYYCMLEVDSKELQRRLMEYRFSTPERIANLLKYEGVSVEQFLENNMRHVEYIKHQAQKNKAHFIDTTSLSKAEVCEQIVQWIQK